MPIAVPGKNRQVSLVTPEISTNSQTGKPTNPVVVGSRIERRLCRLSVTMTPASYARLLVPLAVLVFIGGWALAVVAFFVIGTETCAQVQVPLAGQLNVCQDTTSNAVILLTVIGFAATVGSLFLLALHFILRTLSGIESKHGKGADVQRKLSASLTTHAGSPPAATAVPRSSSCRTVSARLSMRHACFRRFTMLPSM